MGGLSKGPPIIQSVSLSLEEVFQGTTKRFKIGRKLLNGDKIFNEIHLQVPPGAPDGFKAGSAPATNARRRGLPWGSDPVPSAERCQGRVCPDRDQTGAVTCPSAPPLWLLLLLLTAPRPPLAPQMNFPNMGSENSDSLPSDLIFEIKNKPHER